MTAVWKGTVLKRGREPDRAGPADHVMKAFHLRRRAVTEPVSDNQMLLPFVIGVFEAADQEGIAVDLVAETGELAVAGLQDLPADPRQFVFVATRYGVG